MALTGAGIGYGGAVLIGLPGFLLLRKHGFTSWRSITALGFAAGMILCVVFLLALAVLTDEITVEKVFRMILDRGLPWKVLFNIFCGGLLGVLVGFTTWLIARPDKDAERCNR